MTVNVTYFDTRTGSLLKHHRNKDQALQRRILGDSLLEFFYGQQDFYTGKLDKFTTAQELKDNKISDTELLLSSKGATYYFTDRENSTDKIFPDVTHRAAYGSILLGGCQNSSVGREEPLRVLVVDDVSGESGGYLSPASGRKLTGDCHGKVSIPFAESVFKTSKTVTQFRFGVNQDPALGTWIAKGVVSPIKMDFEDIEWLKGNRLDIDIIIPTSSFKGKKAGVKDLPQPGLYTIDADKYFIGQKGVSKLTQVAMSQLIPSYPDALRDILPVISREAKKLAIKQRDIVSLAELYCSNHEEREIALLENSDEDLEQRTDPSTYRVIRAALDKGNYTWLKVPAIVDELEKFVAGEWRDLAIGKTKALAWDGAVIIPSKDLRNGEVCVPWLEDGEKLLYYRSPFINSNGACVGINRKDIWELNPASGANISNIIYVSDQSVDQILAAKDSAQSLYDSLVAEYGDRESLLAAAPERLEEFDQALDDIEYFKGLVAPYESIEQFKELYQTDAERMQADYDGDNIAVTTASRFPRLAAEIEKKLLPENLLPAIKKLPKASFEENISLEDAVVFMAGAYVQLINASGTNLVATLSEVDLVKQHGSLEDKYNFLLKVKLNGLNFAKSLSEGVESRSLVTGDLYSLHTSEDFDRAYAPFKENPFLSDLESLQKLGDVPNKKRFVYYLRNSVDDLIEANRIGKFGFIDDQDNLIAVNLPDSLLKAATDLSKKLKYTNTASVDSSLAAYSKFSDSFIAVYGDRSLSHRVPVVTTGAEVDLDKALDQYAAAVATGIGETGQQNQIAVDIFKSARLPDEGLVDGIKGLIGNRVQILSDKRKGGEFYKHGKMLEANNYSPFDVIATLVNSFYVDNRVGDSTIAESFKEYFETIPTPEEYRAFAQYYRGRYNDLQKKTHAAEEIEAIEDNLVLILQDEAYRFELTNIDRRLYNEFIKNQDHTIQIFPADSSTHSFEAFVLDGIEPRKLGVVSKKSEAENLELLSNPFENFFLAGSARLEPVNLISQDLKAETNELLKQFSEEIDTRGYDRRTMVATLGKTLTTGNSKLNFLVRAMPQDFGFFIQSDGGLNMKFPKGQLLESQVGLLDSGGSQEFRVDEDVVSKSKVLSVVSATGQLEPVANLSAETMLVPGVGYTGSLASRAPTLSIEANFPKLGDRTFKVGKLLNYDFKQILTGEEVEFRVQRKHQESYNVFVTVDGQRVALGRIEQSKLVFELLKGQESTQIMAEEVNQFYGLSAIKLNLGGESVYLSVVGAGGSKGDKEYTSIQDVAIDISMDMNRSLAPTMIVEAKIDDQFVAIGEITQKDDLRLLQSLTGESLIGKATSKISMVDFVVEKAAKSFDWEIPPVNLSTVQNPLLEKLINVNGFNPSVLAEGKVAWLMPDGQIEQLPTISLALSTPVAGTAINWLKSKGIDPLVMPFDHPEVNTETQRGYTVVRIPSEDMPGTLRSSLVKRFGAPLSMDAITDNLAIEVLLSQSSPVSPYETELLTKQVIEPTVPTILRDLKPWLQKNMDSEALDVNELPKSKPVPINFKAMARDIDQNFQGNLRKAGDYLVAFFPSRGLRDNAVSNLGFIGLEEKLEGKYAAIAPAIEVDSYLDNRAIQFFDRDPQNPFREISEKEGNPLASLLAGGKASSKQHRDMLMAGEANKFVGRSIVPGQSFVDQYSKAWGQEAAKNFASSDVIMVSGDTKIDDKVIARTVFDNYYVPLLDQASAVGSRILVGNSPGLDRMVQKYLKSQGYEFSKENGYYSGKSTGISIDIESKAIAPTKNLADTKVTLANTNLGVGEDAYGQKPDQNPLLEVLGNGQIFQHDLTMSSRANKFIGTFLSDGVRALYPGCWGERSNLSRYTSNDVVMVVGDSISRNVPGDTICEHFDSKYKPLLSSAVSAGATILTGDRRGVDKEVQNFLISNGYKLEFSNGVVTATVKPKIIPTVGSIPEIAPPVMFQVDGRNRFVSSFMKQCVYEYTQTSPDLGSEQRFIAGIQRTIQKPEFREKIEEFGGVKWLETCSFYSKVSPQMSGKSLESGFIRIAIELFEGKEVTTKVQLKSHQEIVDRDTVNTKLGDGEKIEFTVVDDFVSARKSPVSINPMPNTPAKVSIDELVPLRSKADSDSLAIGREILAKLQKQGSRSLQEGVFTYSIETDSNDTPVILAKKNDQLVYQSRVTGYDADSQVILEADCCEIDVDSIKQAESLPSMIVRPAQANDLVTSITR